MIGDIYLRQEGITYWLGYTINPLYARQGYAREAAGGIIKWIGMEGGSCIKAGVLPKIRRL